MINNLQKYLQSIAFITILTLLTSIARLFKISFIWGSYTYFFNGINFVIPLFGLCGGITSSGLGLGLYFIIRSLVKGTSLTLGLPTTLAAMNWSATTRDIHCAQLILQVAFPLACITLFIAHPIGSQAYMYSFYWLIPVSLYGYKQITKNESVFLTALSSTFIAHATGSIMFLYFYNLPAPQWLALIPLVAVERFVFATGSTILYYTMQHVYTFVKNSLKKRAIM